MAAPVLADDIAVRSRGAQAIAAAAAILTVTAVLGGHAPRGGAVPLGIFVALATVAAVALPVPLRRTGRTATHSLLPGLALLACAAAILVPAPPVVLGAGLLLCWVGCLAALLLPRPAAAWHLGLMAAGYAAVVWQASIPGGALLWAALAITLVVLAGTVALVGQQARELSRTDAVTLVANRRFWELTLEHECARANRTSFPLCVAVVVLDDFRQYAYERGHAAADQLLREAAGAWTAQIRAGDLVGRLAPDQFAVLLPECGSAAARLVLERLQAAAPPGRTCSAGLATWNGRESTTAILHRAAEALQNAQRTGRSCATIAAA